MHLTCAPRGADACAGKFSDAIDERQDAKNAKEWEEKDEPCQDQVRQQRLARRFLFLRSDLVVLGVLAFILSWPNVHSYRNQPARQRFQVEAVERR